MDNWLEFIVPLIFAGIYFFGNMLSKSGEDKPAQRPRQRPLTPVEDPEAVERQRRIQEEIRRKILERRAAAENQSNAPRRELVETRKEEPLARPVYEEPVSPARPPTLPKEAMVESKQETQSDRGEFSWAASSQEDAYETVMQRRLQEIEATKQQAEGLKRQAAQAQKRSQLSQRKRTPARSGARALTGSVRQTLRNPSAARAAFIYGEVLGQPVSLRKSSSVPGLNS